MSFPVENRAGLPDPAFAALAAEVAGHTSVKKALDRWLGRAPPDVTAQDEFSHDVVFLTPHGWLAYDCT